MERTGMVTENSLAKDFLKKLIGFSIPTWVNFAIGFLSVPIVTRLFLPEEVGRINLFVTYQTVFLLLALFGIDQSFIRFFNEPPGNNDKNGLLIISAGLGIVFATIIICIMFLMRTYLSVEITGTPGGFIFTCLTFSLIANIFLRYVGLYYRMENNVLLYSIQAIALTVVGKMLYVGVAILNPTHMFAIIAMTIGYCCLGFGFSLYIYRTELKGNILHNLKLNRIVISELFKFGVPLVPVSILSWLNNSMSHLLLNRYVSFSAIGIYSNAVTVAGIIGLIQVGFSTYWVPFVYANYQSEHKNIIKLHNFISFFIVFFGLLIIFGQDLIYFLIGANFKESKVFFPLLLIAPVCYTIADTTGIGIDISKKSYLRLFPFIAGVGLNLTLCVILLPRIGVLGAAIAAGSASILQLIITSLLGQRHYRTIEKFGRTVSAVSIIIVAVTTNVIFFERTFFKNTIFMLLCIVLVVLYWKEFIEGIRFSANLVVFKNKSQHTVNN